MSGGNADTASRIWANSGREQLQQILEANSWKRAGTIVRTRVAADQ
jgi:hypothetical protein